MYVCRQYVHVYCMNVYVYSFEYIYIYVYIYMYLHIYTYICTYLSRQFIGYKRLSAEISISNLLPRKLVEQLPVFSESFIEILQFWRVGLGWDLGFLA